MASIASDLITYRDEIINFLQSLTLKNRYQAEAYNKDLHDRGYVIDESNPTTWKYYRNLIGEYHESDTVMTVLSLDTQEEIEFRKSLLNTHPRTRAAYRPGYPLYEALIKRYPNQSDLIKNIAFPVSDINAAIAADDLDILAYGQGYLETDELPKIIRDIEEFMHFTGQRWYNGWLEYEPYYLPTFWGTLWQLLFAAICDSRISNIRTSYVHSYHIWDYLTSHGIGNYKDILTRRQSLFLYRNIRYIIERRGRNDNLTLLVNELLAELSVGMVGKILYQQTFDGEEDCRWVPEFVSEPIQTKYAEAVPPQPPQTPFDITNRLQSLGLELDDSFEYVEARTRELQATSSSRLPTKLLEIQPVVINRQYSALLTSFMNDVLMRTVQDDRYNYEAVVIDELTGITIRLYPNDILALAYYCFYRSVGETPVELPNRYTPNIGAYSFGKTFEDIPERFTYNGNKSMAMLNVLDRESFCGDAIPQEVLYSSPDLFMVELGRSFETMIDQVTFLRSKSQLTDLVGTKTAIFSLLDREHYMINLSPFTLYSQWFASPANANAQALISNYENSLNARSLYADMAVRLIESILPSTHPSVRPYLDAEEDRASYNRIKELFIQLCSYTVLFLDTERDKRRWLFLPDLTSDMEGSSKSAEFYDSADGIEFDLDTSKKTGDSEFPLGNFILKSDGMHRKDSFDSDLADTSLNTKQKKVTQQSNDMIYLSTDTATLQRKTVRITDTIGITSKINSAS